jgi:hypothetical protein
MQEVLKIYCINIANPFYLANYTLKNICGSQHGGTCLEPSSWEVEAEGLGVEASLSYTVRPCLKNNTVKLSCVKFHIHLGLNHGAEENKESHPELNFCDVPVIL